MFTKKIHQTNKVALETRTENHLAGLYKAGQYPDIWQWVLSNYTKTPNTLKQWFENTAQFVETEQLVFAIIDKRTQQIVGTTRIFRLDIHNLNAEIGHTFLSKAAQRTYVNTHAKYLLLSYAFNELGLVRINFNTHEQNKKSRSAITRLGAQFEGIAQKDRRLDDGSYRNTAKFSIIDEHWPRIKRQLSTWH